ncbi:hypothetical protein [Nocardia flavorosea]|uniref:Dihydrodipicolinate reductase n=1 Tax=Nocardia flavorosea TaxID=53429 RepID=A0A846YCH8_9NOCA|nr:hypothetical protein [Nocardia flavorosea]NKY54888.1 hypothetical protein [Nocardia flavorosea]
MSSSAVAVAVLGAGLLAEPIADRIGARPDLQLTGLITDPQVPPAGTGCLVYVPSFAEIAAEAPATILPRLLREGYDVISTAPQNSHGPDTALADACHDGNSVFHATGAFQTTVPARLLRAVTEVTRDIRRVELVEELDFTGAGVYPWGPPGEVGIGTVDTAVATRAAALIDGYYTAGLRILNEAVFGSTTGSTETPAGTVDIVTDAAGTVEQVIVNRTLGAELSYRSIWSAATAERAPLRYRLTTTTDTGKGTANVRFKCMAGVHPADHLTCVNAVEAIRPVHELAPGAVLRDVSTIPPASERRLIC